MSGTDIRRSLYRDSVRIKEIDFDFRLNKDAYLVFIFNLGEDHYDGLRFSSYPIFPNVYVKSTAKGLFQNKEKLALDIFPDGEKNSFHAEFVDDEVVVHVNKKLVFRRKIEQKKAPVFGFRGGQNNVMVDNLRVLGFDGMLIEDNFANRKGVFLTFVGCFIFLAIVLCGVFFLPPLKNKDLKEKMFMLAASELMLCCLIAILFVYDNFYQSLRYPLSSGLLADKERYWRNTEEEKVLIEIMRGDTSGGCSIENCSEVLENAHKIIFLGSSQTWGAGAHTKEDVFTNILARKLNQNRSGKEIVCINAGISGSNSKRMLALLKDDFIKLAPDIVVVNLSNNDDPDKPQEFADNLQAMVDFCRDNGIDIFFMLEPNSVEHRNELRLNSIMRNVAKENSIVAIEMNNILMSKYDDGFLWWDNVHMNSPGHQLMAESLYETFYNVMKDSVIE